MGRCQAHGGPRGLGWGHRIGGTCQWLCRRRVTPVCVETEAGLVVVVAGGQGGGMGPWETMSHSEQGQFHRSEPCSTHCCSQ